MTTRHTRRARASAAGSLLAIALTLSACGGTDQDIPSKGNPVAGATSAPATTSSSTPTTSDAPATYSPVGDFTAEQVQAAVEAAEEAVGYGSNADLVTELKAATTADRAAVLAPYVTADVLAVITNGSTEAADFLDRSLLDPETTTGETVLPDDPSTPEPDGYAGVDITNVRTSVAEDTGLLLVEFDYRAQINTTEDSYAFTRAYTIEMTEAPGTDLGWLISYADVPTADPASGE